MRPAIFYCGGTTDACRHAGHILMDKGIQFTESPDSHVTDLILDVPSFRKNGLLRSGQDPDLLLNRFSGEIRVWGGNLSSLEGSYFTEDLLKDPRYLAENAAITADCAVRLAGPQLQKTWSQNRVLVIGWGRIGKSLCRMLRALGAQVTVCARKAPDRALLSAFGYETADPDHLETENFDVMFNTAPASILTSEQADLCPLSVDLASGDYLPGDRTIHAGGLPGKYAPVSSGLCIAETIFRLMRR